MHLFKTFKTTIYIYLFIHFTGSLSIYKRKNYVNTTYVEHKYQKEKKN